MVLEIKRLLYDKRFTIAGARKALDPKLKVPVRKDPARNGVQGDLFHAASPDLTGIRSELAAILKLLQ